MDALVHTERGVHLTTEPFSVATPHRNRRILWRESWMGSGSCGVVPVAAVVALRVLCRGYWGSGVSRDSSGAVGAVSSCDGAASSWVIVTDASGAGGMLASWYPLSKLDALMNLVN